MRRTKIVCTIGPATASFEKQQALVDAGMNVARLNFSHGSHEFHAQAIDNLRQLSWEKNIPLALLQDLCGPKIRLGRLPEEGLKLKPGEEVTFTLKEEGSSVDDIPLPHSTLFAMLRPGEPMSIDDGRIKLTVSERATESIRATVVIGGRITSHKGVNLPQTRLPVSSVTDKDLHDLRFGIEHDLDWVAVSFVRSALDLEPVKRSIEAAKANTRVIAKIEKREAVERLDEILEIADGVMVARGDLGVEMPIHQVPLIQKDIIRRCNLAGKPAIVATQMLESMIRNPDPTRAEATDIANSILDGTDAVMLSGETAVGEYPVAAVKIMHDIAQSTETVLADKSGSYRHQAGSVSVTESVSSAVCRIAGEVGAKAILCNTTSGGTAKLVSKYRPTTPIIAFTPATSTYRQLALCWGIAPCLLGEAKDTENMFIKVIETAMENHLVAEGDKVVITSGVPIGTPGSTSLIKVHTIGQPIES